MTFLLELRLEWDYASHYWLDWGSVRLIILSARSVRLSYWVCCHIECSFGSPSPFTIESLISCIWTCCFCTFFYLVGALSQWTLVFHDLFWSSFLFGLLFCFFGQVWPVLIFYMDKKITPFCLSLLTKFINI